MKVNQKPQLSRSDAFDLLQREWPVVVSKVETIAEGEDSQALRFNAEGKLYVLRINKSDYGFKKDSYAFRHFASPDIPIPEVFQIGQADNEHAYCVSEFDEDPTLQDLGKSEVETLLSATLAMQERIAEVDISKTTGYGEFDLSGNGTAKSWPDWLLTHISLPAYDWASVITTGMIEKSFLDRVFAAFRRLIDQVPNERKLIHGDFGSNNLITRDGKIAAVIDWDAAGYGDWLFGVAGAYYWRKHLLCMELATDYYESELKQLPKYKERILCYQLRAGLIEMYVQAHRSQADKLSYHINRVSEILQETEKK